MAYLPGLVGTNYLATLYWSVIYFLSYPGLKRRLFTISTLAKAGVTALALALTIALPIGCAAAGTPNSVATATLAPGMTVPAADSILATPVPISTATLAAILTVTPAPTPAPTLALTPTATSLPSPTATPVPTPTATPSPFLTVAWTSSAPATYPFRDIEHHVVIDGDGACNTQSIQALDLLRSKAPTHYGVVNQYVGIIQCVESGSGMAADLDPPRYLAGGETKQAGTIWYAGTIVHDTCHAKLYHDFLAQSSGATTVPSDIWKARKQKPNVSLRSMMRSAK